MQGLIGRKVGMTQVFGSDGRRVAVTVIEAGPCVVVQRKTRKKDGYDAVQLGFGVQKEHRMSKPAAGHCKKSGSKGVKNLKEFGIDTDEEVKEGDAVTVSILKGTKFVDVSGTTKGRGFQGVIKRYRMAGGPKTHGGHSKRRVGSIGQCSYPARVAKGTRMPGHMGNVNVTARNLKIVEVRGDDNLLLVQGAVPGPNGRIVCVKKALKNRVVAG
jgi:large subunit ribosomal protein L3